MRTLITGAGGQVGRHLLRSAPTEIEALGLTRADLDLTDFASMDRYIRDFRPAVLVNAAAYTAVDLAEREPEHAQAVNADAVGTLARICNQYGIRLLHISTDFVFDGTAGRPYATDAATMPVNVYGATKLDGERRVRAQVGLDACIVRTAWVYAATGRNFVSTMLKLFRERTSVRVVADQVGTPTGANSLAQCLWRAALAQQLPQLMHFTDAGVASWYDFAVAIHEEARGLGLLTQPVEIVPIRTEEYPAAARRPSYSVLDTRETIQRLGLVPIHWRINLRNVLQELLS